MTDYERSLEFGCALAPDAAAPPVHLAQELDATGLDMIGVQDHPYQSRHLDTWTLLSVIAASTTQVRIFPDVACLPLRPPAVLAKAAASLDVLSGGRAELALGAGHFWDAIEAYGGERRSPAAALTALEEAIAVVRLIWSEHRRLRFDGDHYRLDGARPGPQPFHPMEIWLGVGGPRAAELVGRAADGWLPSLGPVTIDRLPSLQAIIDEAAVQAGRRPSAIRRMLNVSGRISSRSEGSLIGPPGQWAAELAELAVEYGIDTFVFTPQDEPGAQVRRFVHEVVPATRDQVARTRNH